ncbi:MAG TPA: ATP-binding protein, partial [Stellaceae bacterium]|nr:ATP-binding protein [Stellaceae bacterium]
SAPAGAQRLDGVERALRRYLGDDPQRFISVRRVDDGDKTPGWRLRRYFDARAQIVVSLASGGFLRVEAGDELISRIFGLPAGFWAGVIGFAAAALAIVAVIRETRPLALLVRSVDKFGAALEPAPLPERGAREVRSLIRAVNRMQSRIAELVKTRTLVIGAISHDLRTYLTRLRLRVETLPEGETRLRAVNDVENMQALIEDALTFARATFVGVKKERIDLAALVARECEERASAGKAVAAAVPRGTAMVDGSAPALARVVGNLVDNAVAYGDAAEVSLAHFGDKLELRVEDRGPGVPASEREHIFEPFHRIEASRNRERGGAGLGLAIARQIVEGHRGRITVEDRPGGGARFIVRLPAAYGDPLR